MGFVIRNGKLVQEQDKSGRQAFGGEAVEWLVGRGLLIGERGADGGMRYGPTRALADKLKNGPGNDECLAALASLMAGRIDGG
jgi:hypothetical protein